MLYFKKWTIEWRRLKSLQKEGSCKEKLWPHIENWCPRSSKSDSRYFTWISQSLAQYVYLIKKKICRNSGNDEFTWPGIPRHLPPIWSRRLPNPIFGPGKSYINRTEPIIWNEPTCPNPEKVKQLESHCQQDRGHPSSIVWLNSVQVAFLIFSIFLSYIGKLFKSVWTKNSACFLFSLSRSGVCNLDRLSATGISEPGLYTNFKLYGCIDSIICCSCGSALDIGFTRMLSKGLWSVVTVMVLPYIYTLVEMLASKHIYFYLYVFALWVKVC